MANVGETARQIYSTLVEFNRVEVPDLLRAKTVEKFRPSRIHHHQPSRNTTSTQVCHCRRRAGRQPLSPASCKRRWRSRQGGRQAPHDRRRQCQISIGACWCALHRALHLPRADFAAERHQSTSDGPGIWREISSIYAYASQNNVPRTSQSDDEGQQHNQHRGPVQVVDAVCQRDPRSGCARVIRACCSRALPVVPAPPSSAKMTAAPAWAGSTWTFGPTLHRCANSLRTPMPGKRMAILDVRELLKETARRLRRSPWDNRSGCNQESRWSRGLCCDC